MSYPDEWNRVDSSVPDAVMSEARQMVEYHIEALSVQKDIAVKMANYPLAAKLRDAIDKVKACRAVARQSVEKQEEKHERGDKMMFGLQKTATPVKQKSLTHEQTMEKMGHRVHDSRFKKALIVPNHNLQSWPRNIFEMYEEADVVIDEEGHLLKSRYTGLVKGMTDKGFVRWVESALHELSGDLNYGSVAQAKQILKNVLASLASSMKK